MLLLLLYENLILHNLGVDGIRSTIMNNNILLYYFHIDKPAWYEDIDFSEPAEHTKKAPAEDLFKLLYLFAFDHARCNKKTDGK